MSTAPIVFTATGTIQAYAVETSGTYLLEAAGAQGGAGEGPGSLGARVSGMFHLKRGDRLKIVAGRRGIAATPQRPAGRGGDSLVWTGSADLPQPVKLMLSARGGRNSTSAPSAADAPSAPADGIKFNGNEVDPRTADTLATQWTDGAETSQVKARTDPCGYNAGAFRTSQPALQAGDGYVSITPVAVSAAPPAPAAGGAEQSAPAGVTRPDEHPPSPTLLPPVTPRPASWAEVLRLRRPSGNK